MFLHLPITLLDCAPIVTHAGGIVNDIYLVELVNYSNPYTHPQTPKTEFSTQVAKNGINLTVRSVQTILI